MAISLEAGCVKQQACSLISYSFAITRKEIQSENQSAAISMIGLKDFISLAPAKVEVIVHKIFLRVKFWRASFIEVNFLE